MSSAFVRAVAGGAVALGLMLAGAPVGVQAAQDPPNDRCDPKGPVSIAYYDPKDRSFSQYGRSVTYETTSAGTPRRTIYLVQGGYIVSVCQPSGAVHEELYHQLSKSSEPKPVFIMDLKPDGEANGVHIDYADPTEGDSPSDKVTASAARHSAAQGVPVSRAKALTLARKTKISAAAKAIRSWNLKPGSRAHMTRFVQATRRPGSARAAYLGNKCYHDSRIWTGGLRPGRAVGYVSALGSANSWIVYSGAVAFSDLWNFCGWGVGSGLTTLNAGDIGSFTVSNEGLDQIGWDVGYGGSCGGVSSLACNYTYWYWDSSLNVYRIVGNDIAVNPNVLWANGAVIGRYDLQSTIAHEVGHSWGFGDIPPSVDPYAADQMMYGVGQAYQDHERYLGYGDYMLMRTVYP